MRISLIATVALASTLGHQAPRHLNPMIDLHIAKKPLFGLYLPSNRGGRGAVQQAAPKTPAQLVQDAFAYPNADFVFDGSMETDFDRGYGTFSDLAKEMRANAVRDGQLHHPVAVKTHEIAPDTTLAKQRIAKQLNLGVSTIVFVGVESADEVKTGLAAMRFKSKGGTRPDDVGDAPAFWGMSEQQYKQKADVWPLNANGELTNWTIVESLEGLKHVREIAAVKGIAVLFPGAGTLRQVFRDNPEGWEPAIQQVLSACKEFNVPCGFPANDSATVELRMKQGFSVFIANWGDNGFKAVEFGKKNSGR